MSLDRSDEGVDSTGTDPARPAHERYRALAGRALGARITGIETDRLGASNAVHFVTRSDGAQYVLRLSPSGQGDLVAQEIWALRQARIRGVPTPEIVFADTTQRDYAAPYMIMRRLPGIPAFQAPLTEHDRTIVLHQLGKHLRAIHGLPVTGFGYLEDRDGVYVGGSASWSSYIRDEVQKRLAKLPPHLLPTSLTAAIKDCFARADADLALERAMLLHGDYQYKNILVQGSTVTGILDFETLLAGDPIFDFCALYYWSAEPATTLRHLLDGYGSFSPETPFLRRLRLYEILLAIEIVWWEEHFHNQPGVRSALTRLMETVAAFERL